MNVSKETAQELTFLTSDAAIKVFDMYIAGATNEECEKALKEAKSN